MRRWIFSVIGAFGAAAAGYFKLRNRKQKRILGVLQHGMREDQFHKVQLAIDAFASGAQVICFSGYVGTALFTFIVSISPRGKVRACQASLVEETAMVYPFLPTDAHADCREIYAYLIAFVEKHGIHAKITTLN